MDEKNNFESEFLQLIMGMESSGWMTLGKIANPMTGKMEKSLQAAKSVIDTLLMLKEKTKGNLSRTEESVLNGAIQNLEINYIEESKKPQEGSMDTEKPLEEKKVDKQEQDNSQSKDKKK